MFKKGPDIDKKKLLSKALDVKKDSLTRLKHFKTLIEHIEFNELPALFRTHFSFIYHTFIDTFSTFDCNSKQRRDDLECILFMLEKILTYNPELIKKRWQFYSITFVMQKLLHQSNTFQLRQEGVRLFILWYQILCDETNAELQIMFGSLVRGIVPQSSLPVSSPTTPSANIGTSQQQQQYQQYSIQQQQQQQQKNQTTNNNLPQANLPIKLCSIDPLVPMSPNEQLPSDETSFYLDSLLQYLVTQTTKPIWASQDEARKNQELGFSFTFNMFKKIYLPHLFPNFNLHLDSPTRSYLSNHSVHQYVDEMANDTCQYINTTNQYNGGDYNNYNNYNNNNNNLANTATSPTSISSTSGGINSKRDALHIDLKHSNHFVSSPSPIGQSSIDHERTISLSSYQAIVIKWLTRILRQDMIPGQDELIRSGNSVERQANSNNNNSSSSRNDPEYNYTLDPNSSTIFQGIETTSREMEIARRVIGTWPDNIEVIHDLFRRAFLNYYQPASMKRVVNVYKEWICNGGPNQNNPTSGGGGGGGRQTKLGYTSFSDLLQVFVLNSSSAFVTRVQNAQMLEEQVEMCKRIMNIYRYMVMKIYMNTSTWEQLLNVMLSITERLFPIHPPEKKENTIGGRIAPAFFQTFIVSWIRANLYVHISSQMWHEFHRVMKSLVRWRELVEEWRTTMGSLTRVLVKHVYGLSLTDLPLDRPQERRRRPKATKSFSTAEASPVKSPTGDQKEHHHSTSNSTTTTTNKSSTTTTTTTTAKTVKPSRAGSIKLPATGFNRGRLARSNSYGTLFQDTTKLYYTSSVKSSSIDSDHTNGRRGSSTVRKIKSEYFLFESTSFYASASGRSSSPSNNDVMDGSSLKDSNLIIEHDHALDSHSSSSIIKSPNDMANLTRQPTNNTTKSKQQHQESSRIMSDKCVLLGGSVRGWTSENSVIMWRRMLGLFGNINHIEDIDNHFVAVKCLESILGDFIKTRDNLAVSLDNQCTPEQPRLIPPYTYPIAWLLEATHLPRQYRESRLLAHELLCSMFIRRHDIELSSQHYGAFYEVLQRALASPDPTVHASIIKNTSQLLALELPGSTFLVHALYERSRSILASVQKGQPAVAAPRDQAIQILNSILALQRPIKKLLLSKMAELSPVGGDGGVVLSPHPGDIKSRVFDTLLACNIRPVILDSQTRCKSLCSMALHVYQELAKDKLAADKDLVDVEKLFDTLLGELQDWNEGKSLFRMNCDLLRLFSDHAQLLAHSKPALVSSLLRIICQLIIRLSADDSNMSEGSHKELVHFLLICLEDWCLTLGKSFLIKPIDQLVHREQHHQRTEEPHQDSRADDGDDDDDDGDDDQSLMTIILRSLDNVINDGAFKEESSSFKTQRAARGSIGLASRNHSDNHSTSQDSKSSTVGQDNVSHPDEATLSTSTTTTTSTPATANQSKHLSAIKLACKVSHHKLITYMGHFPLRQVGAASMSCCVNESDYLTASEQQPELTDFKNTPGVFLFVIDGTTIVSFIGAADSSKQEHPQTSQPICRPIHLIIRNLCGKYSWDVSCVETMNNRSFIYSDNHTSATDSAQTIVMDPETFQETATRSSMMNKYDSDFNEDGNSSGSLSSRSSSSRDCIGDILQQLSISLAYAGGSAGGSSIASYQNMQRKRNSAQSVSNPKFKLAQAEETMIALLTNQRFQELNYCDKSDDMDRVVLNLGSCERTLNNLRPDKLDIPAPAHDNVALSNSSISCPQQQQSSSRSMISLEQCRQLVQQLGYLSWEKRCKIDSLAKSARLLRELKNLDAQSSRETHKIAVFYVAHGQEDKNSILLNSTGSRAFEDFVSGLGWEVNLASHLGFKGGLQTNKSTGETSCYYCNGTTEVMFHVSTKIPAGPAAANNDDNDESLNKKLRHLGNDEIHIVWSEHSRDYRRGIIPTEFGDVIIAIYPMLTFQGYYRVQISSKQDVPIFGPLFDNCLVHQTSLAPLVRATAINASRAKRLTLPFYRSHFEERSQLIDTLVRNHTEKLSFEEFAMQLYNSGELKAPQGVAASPTSSSTGQQAATAAAAGPPSSSSNNTTRHHQEQPALC